MEYWEAEAAIAFGVAIDEFRAKPLMRRAEMVAHLWIKGARRQYEEWREEEKAKKKGRQGSGGFNPIEAQKRAWNLG